MADPNLRILEDAAAKLGPLADEVVFVGGAILTHRLMLLSQA
jgi:hypothetical protein